MTLAVGGTLKHNNWKSKEPWDLSCWWDINTTNGNLRSHMTLAVGGTLNTTNGNLRSHMTLAVGGTLNTTTGNQKFILFVWFDSLRPSQHFFSYVRPGLPGLNQYWARIIVSCLFTVEVLSLLYLLFISWFICSRRWFIDKLWIFMQTKPLCVLIHIWTKGEVETGLSPPVKCFYWPFQGSTSFVDHSCHFCLVFVMLVRLFIDALWSPAGKSWPLGSHLWCLMVRLLLSHWYPGSGVVLNCINSWYFCPLFTLLKDTTQWPRWGSNRQPLSLESNTLPLSHCTRKVI